MRFQKKNTAMARTRKAASDIDRVVTVSFAIEISAGRY